MGGVVALALACGWFGVAVDVAIGLGVKVAWSDADLAGAAALADRAPRTFATADEAVARYLRVSGLEGLVDPATPQARDGVVEAEGSWQLAHDPASFAVGAPDMGGLLTAARGRVLLAAGERDPMSPEADLRALDAEVAILDGLGHNAHVEDPEAVWALVTRTAGVG